MASSSAKKVFGLSITTARTYGDTDCECGCMDGVAEAAVTTEIHSVYPTLLEAALCVLSMLEDTANLRPLDDTYGDRGEIFEIP